MNRRAFLGALATGGAATGLVANGARFASGPVDSSRERPWLVRFSESPITGKSAEIFDARTGENVASRIPYVCATRCERSRVTQRPVRVVLFRLKDGYRFVIGDRLATEPAWLQAIG